MFWLFVACLLAIVSLFSVKFYEHRAGGFVLLSGSRRSLDRRLSQAGKSLQRQLRQTITLCLSTARDITGEIRHSLAESLRSLASRIDLR